MRKREHFIGLWLDDREYKHLLKQRSVSGLSVSALIRHSVMGVELRPRPPDAYRELSAIGNNINQIAHNTNAKKEAEAAEVDEAVKLVYQALRLVKEAL